MLELLLAQHRDLGKELNLKYPNNGHYQMPVLQANHLS